MRTIVETHQRGSLLMKCLIFGTLKSMIHMMDMILVPR